MRRRDARRERYLHDGHGPGRSRLLNLLLFVLFFTVLLILPCFFWVRVYQQITGIAASLPVRFGLSFCWLFLVFGLIFALAHLRQKISGPVHRPARNMFDDVMDALDRIAVGDYNVTVQRQDHFRYSELADKVNALARDLSSLEQMRQEFVSNVSHEIQSPLTSIAGFAALLKKEELPQEQRLHYLEIIEAESRRLSGLSENLLRLSMLDADQPTISPKPFRLDRQMQDILLMLEPQWSAKGIEPDVALDKVMYTGDEDLLSQVWINLLHNAVKFTPEGGGVSVRLEQRDGAVVCVLTDTGAGIPAEELARIFERFYKVDKARDRALGGNGLGLSIVSKILHLHGGAIRVDSEPGKGTTFTVTLPVEEEATL